MSCGPSCAMANIATRDQLTFPDSLVLISLTVYVAVSLQDKAAEARRVELLSQLKKKIGPVVSDLQRLLKAFDSAGNGRVTRHDLVAGCASVGVVLNDKDFDTLAPVMTTNPDGTIDYAAFCSVFTS